MLPESFFVLLYRNSSKKFPVKSVFRKLIKILCWFWIFTYVTMLIPSYGNISTFFTDIIFATITFSLIHYRWDVACLILQIKQWSYIPCFPNYNKGVLFFCKSFQLSDKFQCIVFIWLTKRYSNVNCVSVFLQIAS